MTGVHFTDFDYIVIGVMVFSCVFAYFRGLVREILSLVAWVGAGIITIYYFPSASQNLQLHFRSPVVAASIAGIGIYLLTLIGFGLINMIIIKSFKSSGEAGMLDNMLGLLFGACRGALMVSLGFFMLTLALPEKEYPDWLKQSVTRPYVAKGAALLARVAPDALFEISSLEREAQGEVQGNAAPRQITVPNNTPPKPTLPDDNDNPATNGQANPGDPTGYNQTSTKQLDRLIESSEPSR